MTTATDVNECQCLWLNQPLPERASALMDRLRIASSGSAELDAHFDAFLVDRGKAPGSVDRYDQSTSARMHRRSAPAMRWSQDFVALLDLVPADHDFSLGRRDGVLWAWIQPRDDWQPAANEARHDHPRGSGLVVAFTVQLALAAALVALDGVHKCARTTPAPPSIQRDEYLEPKKGERKLPTNILLR